MSRYNGKGYMKILKQRRQLKKRGQYAKWAKLGKKASAYRKRMIARNRGHTQQTRRIKSVRMSPESKALYEHTIKTSDGKRVAKRFKQFWKLPGPPSVKKIQGGPKGIIPLMGMGHTDQVHISTGNKGERNKKTKVLKGRWNVATEKSGKHVLLLSSRPMSGGLKFVGYAPITYYIPPKDVEAAGTHKAGFVWKHVHGQADGKNIPKNELTWPKVFADRDGKVDSSSNFVYGSTKRGKITTWMYHN